LSGNIVWYYTKTVQMTRPVPGGTFLALPSGQGTGTGVWGPNVTRQQILREFDLAGNTIHETNCDRVFEQLMALGLEDPLGRFNHEAIRLSNGQTMVLGDAQKIFPAGTQGSSAPLDVVGSLVILLDENFQVISYWNSFDHLCTGGTQVCLNINRPGSEDCVVNQGGQTPGGCPPVLLSSPANDWLHNNSLQYLNDDDIRYLHAEIVDVVLHLDGRAAEAQHASERVAERRVAQVADVRRLVRVDRRMLDDRFLHGCAVGRHLLPDARNEKRQPVEIQIQIAVGRRFDTSHTGNDADGLRQLLRDRARRFAKRPRQLKGDRHSQIAQRAGRRHFHGKRRHVGEAEPLPDRSRNRVVNLSLNT
jgi:hypothetical protein